MSPKSFIRSLGISFLLLVFGFSILPKKTVHDLFASHQDSSFSVNDSKDQQIGWAGFRCNCENLVVESPFVENHFPVLAEIIPAYSAQYIEDAVSFLATHNHHSHLRGPPGIRVC